MLQSKRSSNLLLGVAPIACDKNSRPPGPSIPGAIPLYSINTCTSTTIENEILTVYLGVHSQADRVGMPCIKASSISSVYSL